jgi:hypothetical protein
MIKNPLELDPNNFYLGNSNLHNHPYAIMNQVSGDVWVQWCIKNLCHDDQIIISNQLVEKLKEDPPSLWGL